MGSLWMVLGMLGCATEVLYDGDPPEEPCTCVVDTFDQQGQLVTSVVETYDEVGHLVHSVGTTPSGREVVNSWVYDGDLLVQSEEATDGSREAIRYDHDEQGRFVQVVYEEGVIAGLRIELAYNEHGLASSRRIGAEGELFSETLFHWDEDGRLLGWDALSGDEWVLGATRSYHAASPSLDHTEVRSYSNQDPQSSDRVYNADGKLIEELQVSSFGSETQWFASYDGDGRVVEVAYDDETSPAVVTYTYDSVGREVLRESVPSSELGYNGGRIERLWQCRDQPALPAPRVPGLMVTLDGSPLFREF
jgi:hypothetical protein